jgi:hypothetical protein
VFKGKPKDGNLEMCPEATVAGLYYLMALAATRTAGCPRSCMEAGGDEKTELQK